MPNPVAILIAGQPIDRVEKSRGGFANMIRGVAGPASTLVFEDIDIRGAAAIPAPERFSGIVVTGSASSVTDRAEWVVAGERYLRRAVEAKVPVFGICFGHQMLGQALGGLVEKNPRGREIGTVDLELLANDEILAAATPFRVNETHVDSVTRLPPAAKVLARTALDPHAAIRFSPTTWGVQFHPEMDGEAVAAYIDARRALLASEGIDADALLGRVDDGSAGTATLRRFFGMLAGG